MPTKQGTENIAAARFEPLGSGWRFRRSETIPDVGFETRLWRYRPVYFADQTQKETMT